MNACSIQQCQIMSNDDVLCGRLRKRKTASRDMIDWCGHTNAICAFYSHCSPKWCALRTYSKRKTLDYLGIFQKKKWEEMIPQKFQTEFRNSVFSYFSLSDLDRFFLKGIIRGVQVMSSHTLHRKTQACICVYGNWTVLVVVWFTWAHLAQVLKIARVEGEIRAYWQSRLANAFRMKCDALKMVPVHNWTR